MSASLSRVVRASAPCLGKNRCLHKIRTKVPLSETRRHCSPPPGRDSFLFRLRPCIVSVGYRSFSSAASRTVSSKRCFCVGSPEIERCKMPEAPRPFQRLPRNVKPLHYNLSLVPDFNTFTFKGEESVTIEVGSY